MNCYFINPLVHCSKQITVLVLLLTVVMGVAVYKSKQSNYYSILENEMKVVEKCFNKTRKITCSRKSDGLYIKIRKPNPYELIMREYTHNELDFPTIKDCDYLIAIISEPDMFYEREVFRKIYRKYDFLSFVFITGKSNITKINGKLRKEIEFHHDVLQFDFLSSYYALQLQTYNILVWCLKLHVRFKWLVKHDTDTFFNIIELQKLHEMSKSNSESEIWGYIIGYFPSGMGYVIPHKIINRLINASQPEINRNCYGNPEDVFIGRLSRRSNISMFDVRRLKIKIDDGYIIDSVYNYFMIHRLKPHEIYYLHSTYFQHKFR